MLFYSISVLLALSSFVRAFDPSSKSNLVAFYNGNMDPTRQSDLSDLCNSAEPPDVIVVGFVNYFFDQGTGGYPRIDIGDRCNGDPKWVEGSTNTGFYMDCTTMPVDIPYCQSLGIKILFSLGGAGGSYELSSDAQGTELADLLWGIFGPKQAGDKYPRPLGDAVVDGFDLDIEQGGSVGYNALVNRLRTNFATDYKDYYISATPQCFIPDAHLDAVISTTYFDFIFVQFYNNWCNAVKYFGTPGDKAAFNFKEWSDLAKNSGNPDVKVYLGLPASTGSAGSGYMTPTQVQTLVPDLQSTYDNFGGVMLWEIVNAIKNEDNYGDNYLQACRTALEETPMPSSSSSSMSSTSSTSSSSSMSTSSSSTTTSSSISSSSSSSSSIAPSTSSSTTSSTTTSSSTTSSSSIPYSNTLSSIPTSLSISTTVSTTTTDSIKSTSTSSLLTSTKYIYSNSTMTSSSSTKDAVSFYPLTSRVTTPGVYPTASAEKTYTTITTSYVDVCPTGLTTITVTYTTDVCPTASATPIVPEGWTSTVKVCSYGCGAGPTKVTVTIPVIVTPVGPPILVATAYPGPSYTTLSTLATPTASYICYGADCGGGSPSMPAEHAGTYPSSTGSGSYPGYGNSTASPTSQPSIYEGAAARSSMSALGALGFAAFFAALLI